MARSSQAARERAARIDSQASRRIADSVKAAGSLGDRLVSSVWHARASAQEVQALVEAWRVSLVGMLVDAAERSHRRAWLDGVNEAAEAMVARDRRVAMLARVPADPTTRAVDFLRARVSARPEDIEALRTTYGRLATEIALPLGQNAGRDLHETIAEVVRSNVSRRNGQVVIADALAGVTAAHPYVIETIFRTQHQLAYSAGAAAADADPDIAGIIWGYEYVTVGDDRVRPNHRALDGVKLPKEDPRWSQIRPPNGYSCRCQVLRVFDTDEHGVVEPGPIDFGDGKGPVDPAPDRGWGFNVGEVYSDLRRMDRQAAAGVVASKRSRAVAAIVDGWPSALAGLVDLGAAGGSTGARIVQDAAGRKYVRKAGTSEAHLREESAALEAYRAAGVPVPETRLYTDPETGRPVILSAWEDGVPLSELKGAKREAAIERIREHFGVDALLGNWDVAGQGLDNIIVRPDGTPVRIDVGGSLRFRAQGAPKGDQFGEHPREVFTLRDPAVNKPGAAVFGGMDWGQVTTSLESAVAREQRILAALPEGDIRDTVRRRFEEARELAQVSRPMLGDAFKPAYVERVAYHTQGLRSGGVYEGMAGRMTPRPGYNAVKDAPPVTIASASGGLLVDEKGDLFDNLRGETSVSSRYWAYLKQNVGESGYRTIGDYHRDQAGNSWRDGPVSIKRLWSEQRGVPEDRYWWRLDRNEAKELNGARRDQALEGIAALQAHTMQVLRGVDMPNNDRTGGRVWAARTEARRVVDQYWGEKARRGAVATPLRGAAESYSLFKPVSVDGDRTTWQYIPHHRCLTMYVHGNHNALGSTCLCNDSENEIVAMGEGIPSLYAGKYDDDSSYRTPPGGAWPPK